VRRGCRRAVDLPAKTDNVPTGHRADSRHHQAASARGKHRAAEIELTADDLAEIERAAAAITVEGERYPAHLLATTGR
jgi:hypothetical protein